MIASEKLVRGVGLLLLFRWVMLVVVFAQVVMVGKEIVII
jgi:hypothetical protein